MHTKDFEYLYKDNGKRYLFTFTCPVCGAHSCEHIEIDKDCGFWSGYYKCSVCGNESCDNEPICYYSRCFHKCELFEYIQLELF